MSSYNTAALRGGSVLEYLLDDIDPEFIRRIWKSFTPRQQTALRESLKATWLPARDTKYFSSLSDKLLFCIGVYATVLLADGSLRGVRARFGRLGILPTIMRMKKYLRPNECILPAGEPEIPLSQWAPIKGRKRPAPPPPRYTRTDPYGSTDGNALFAMMNGTPAHRLRVGDEMKGLSPGVYPTFGSMLKSSSRPMLLLFAKLNNLLNEQLGALQYKDIVIASIMEQIRSLWNNDIISPTTTQAQRNEKINRICSDLQETLLRFPSVASNAASIVNAIRRTMVDFSAQTASAPSSITVNNTVAAQAGKTNTAAPPSSSSDAAPAEPAADDDDGSNAEVIDMETETPIPLADDAPVAPPSVQQSVMQGQQVRPPVVRPPDANVEPAAVAKTAASVVNATVAPQTVEQKNAPIGSSPATVPSAPTPPVAPPGEAPATTKNGMPVPSQPQVGGTQRSNVANLTLTVNETLPEAPSVAYIKQQLQAIKPPIIQFPAMLRFSKGGQSMVYRFPVTPFAPQDAKLASTIAMSDVFRTAPIDDTAFRTVAAKTTTGNFQYPNWVRLMLMLINARVAIDLDILKFVAGEMASRTGARAYALLFFLGNLTFDREIDEVTDLASLQSRLDAYTTSFEENVRNKVYGYMGVIVGDMTGREVTSAKQIKPPFKPPDVKWSTAGSRGRQVPKDIAGYGAIDNTHIVNDVLADQPLPGDTRLRPKLPNPQDTQLTMKRTMGMAPIAPGYNGVRFYGYR